MVQATAEVMVREALPETEDWRQRGERIVECVRTRDWEKFAECFDPQVRCRLLIQGALLTPPDAAGVAGEFEQWFGDADRFEIKQYRVSQVGDRLHIGYRIQLRESGVWYVGEQQTFSKLEEGAIATFDLMCSGFHLDPEAN